jgi:Tol biopolymer transport system component
VPAVRWPPPPLIGDVRETKPSNRRGLLAVVLACAAVLLIGAGTAAWILTRPQSTPAGSASKTSHSSHPSTSAAAALSADQQPMFVRLDPGPVWPKECRSVIARLTPAKDDPVQAVSPNGSCDMLPEFSHDHSMLAFTRVRPDGVTEAWVMAPDGSNPTRVTDKLAKSTRVSWSPDDKQLAFTGTTPEGTQAIYAITIGQSSPRRLTQDSATEDDAAWSPDGRHIAFWSERSGKAQIYLLDPNDPNAAWTQVTQPSFAPDHAVDPAWSPDGTTLAFTNGTGNSRIWVVNPDGSAPRQVTGDAAMHMDPCWSRDGKWIGYTQGPYDHPQIWASHPDGSGAKPITTAGHYEGHSTW